MRKAASVALCLGAILMLDLWLHGAMAGRLLAHLHMHPLHPLEHAFWDAQVYAQGIRDYLAGHSPYSLDDLNNPLPFAYPPVFVWIGAALARVLRSSGWSIYVGLYLVSVIGLQMLLGAVFLRRPATHPWLSALCFLPLAALLSVALLAGNIHEVWYFASALAVVPAFKHRDWRGFYLVAFLAMMNQPVFAVLLLLPLFAGVRQYVATAVTLVAVTVGYLVERAVDPMMYALFQQTIAAHLAASHDFGQGIFGLSARALAHFGASSPVVPAALQAMFSLGVLAVLVRLRMLGACAETSWWGLLIVAVVLVNPRIMLYDSVAALIPAASFLVCDDRPSWLAIVAVVVTCVLWHNAVGLTPILLAGFAVQAAYLARELRARRGRTELSTPFM